MIKTQLPSFPWPFLFFCRKKENSDSYVKSQLWWHSSIISCHTVCQISDLYVDLSYLYTDVLYRCFDLSNLYTNLTDCCVDLSNRCVHSLVSFTCRIGRRKNLHMELIILLSLKLIFLQSTCYHNIRKINIIFCT